MRLTARLTTDRLDAVTEFESFSVAVGDAGAIVTFSGVARTTTSDGEAVTGLFLDHHPRLTAFSLEDIAREAAQRFGVEAIHVVHRCGQIAPGETIVFVSAAAAHRRAAFEATEYAMDRLKTDAVLWKREDSIDGSHWVEPTEIDQFDRARWDR